MFYPQATDSSLRDQSADCFRNLIQFTSKGFETSEARKFLNLHVLPVIRLGLKSKIEVRINVTFQIFLQSKVRY